MSQSQTLIRSLLVLASCLLPSFSVAQSLLTELYHSQDGEALTARVDTARLLSESAVSLPLPGGGDAVFSQLWVEQHRDNAASWFGSSADAGQVNAHFAVVGKAVSGRIELDSDVYEITPLDENRIRIAAVRMPDIADCIVSEVEPLTSTDNAPPSLRVSASRNDDGSIIDVLVVYTPQAEAGAGGTNQIAAVAQSAVDAMNASLINSGVPTMINLAHTVLVNYNDSGDSSTDLQFVRNSAEVAALRDIHRADMVSLIVNSTDACGRGYVMRNPGPGFAGLAFQVTARGCAVGNLSFAHEFGHNMGLEHNPENSSAFPNGGSYPWSFGHWHDGEYRTVMSYSSNCSNGCSRRQYFSNPDVMFNGLPTGVADERDNARSLEQTRLIVAQFRENISRSVVFENGFE